MVRMFRWVRRRVRRQVRGGLGLLVLVSWMHAVSPANWLIAAPLPVPLGSFPCAGHACGCLTAEQCWDHCCCYSVAERVAWAEQQHVSAPVNLRTLAAGEQKSCCAARHHDDVAPGPRSTFDQQTKDVPESPTCCTSISPARCHGIFHTLNGGVIAPTPAREPESIATVTPPSTRVDLRCQSPTSLSLPPAPPPPRA